MSQETPLIFIGYRRDDGGHARALYEKLCDWFDAEQVFLDQENLDPGALFRPELELAIRDCRVFLAVIGPHWFSEKNRQRLQEPEDITRGELRAALTQGKAVIPVLAGGAAFPDPGALPGDIAGIAEANAHQQLEAQYRAAFQKLLDSLEHRYGLKPEFRRRDGSRQSFHVAGLLLSPHFADPTGKLAALHECLARGGDAAFIAAALHGMGGVGKTQLALKYSHAFRDEYEGVWWFRCEDSALLEQDCQELCRERGIDRPDDEPPSRSVARWLKKQPRWLLVYDNADGPKAVRPYLPEAGGHHALITSRNPHWGGLVAAVLDLAAWSDEQALEFLHARLDHRLDHAQCRRLAQALGGLPLALELAAAYLEATDLPLDDYLAALADVAEAPRLLDGSAPDTGYPHGVLAALSLAFARLGPAARALLRLSGWFAAEPIPERLFIEQSEHLPEELKQAAGKTIRWRETVAELGRYGLCQLLDIPALEPAAGGSEKGLQFHRLTQAAIRARLAGPEPDLAAVLLLLRLALPKNVKNPSDWPRCNALLPHVKGLERFTALPGFEPVLHAWLLNEAARYLQYGPALYAEAKLLFEQALAAIGAVHGEESKASLAVMNNLAGLLQDQGDLAGARALHERELAICRRVLGDEHPDTLTSRNNLALTIKALGDLTGAQAAHEKVLEARRRVLGEEHPDTLNSMNNLAETLRARGDLVGARVLQEKVLEVCRRVLGEEHPSTLTSMNNLALTLWRMDEHQAALQMLRATAEGFTRVLGPEHPNTLAARRAIEQCQATPGPEAEMDRSPPLPADGPTKENDHDPG